MEFIRNYWMLVAILLWFAYKWLSSKRIKAKLPELRERGAIFVDVRSPAEYSSASAPGTVNYPLQEISEHIKKISKSTPVVLCCASGTRSGIAKMTLKKNGFKEVYNIGTWTNFLN